MNDINIFRKKNQVENISIVEEHIIKCNDKFQGLLQEILTKPPESAHKIEIHIFKEIIKLGLVLLQMFFFNQKQGDYGDTVNTSKGIAQRGKLGYKTYFSIFGKIKIERYIYRIGEESFAPLDIVLNLPKRCYSYFLSEWVNLLNIQDAFGNTVNLLEKFLGLELSVSAAETISQESSTEVEIYYEQEHKVQEITKDKESLTAIGFDGKGVPMIKKEAAHIKGRLGKGEKRQKKKEALVGVKYEVAPQPRSPEQVAKNLIYPEKQEKVFKEPSKSKDIRYIASIEKSKREVMREIFIGIAGKSFVQQPLICLMDGAKSLLRAVNEVFQSIENKVIILDIIHVIEYIWLIAHLMYEEGSEKAREYVYEKLLWILKGGVYEYIQELEKELKNQKWSSKQQRIFQKVITYLENHKAYMKYDEYLEKGYPIATGVIESACGHIVKDRMEITGARWSIPGAENILRLRSVVKSNHWDNYWDFYIQKAQYNIAPFKIHNLLEINQKNMA
jgi:hypothetical protein